jgi:hypothetical protein
MRFFPDALPRVAAQPALPESTSDTTRDIDSRRHAPVRGTEPATAAGLTLRVCWWGVQVPTADPNEWQEPRLASDGTGGRMHWEQEVLGTPLRSVDSLILIVFPFGHH